MNKKIQSIGMVSLLVILAVVAVTPNNVQAGSYDGYDLAMALLTDPSTYVSSQYWDRDTAGHRQTLVLSSRGNLISWG